MSAFVTRETYDRGVTQKQLWALNFRRGKKESRALFESWDELQNYANRKGLQITEVREDPRMA